MFIKKLELIEKYKKEKRYYEAWRQANLALVELAKSGDDMWFMMYYQMADILAREKKWFHALRDMGFVVYYLKGLGGITHEKFVKRLLRKLNVEDKFNEYIELCIKTNPKQIEPKLLDLVG